jgi:hypothetical protein
MDHPRTSAKAVTVVVLAALLAACGDSAELPEEATRGPDPTLPAPKEMLIPTL